MTFELDEDTSLTDLGGGRFAGQVSDRWSIGPYPNGGYVMSLGLRAVAAMLPHPDPFAVSAHYLSPTEHGPCQVDVEVVRTGRAHSTASVRLHQDGAERMRLLATYGDHTLSRGTTVEHGLPPEMPPPDGAVRQRPALMPNRLDPTIRHRFDTRFAPQTAGWMDGAPTGRGEVGGWIRFADGREPDTFSLPLLCDAMPPAVFELTPTGWVPTLELTVLVRRRPEPGWMRAWFTTQHLVGGYLEEDGQLWDSAGRLVAQSRQLARANPPPG